MVLNHYQILGIPADADIRLIKTAYRSMAKRFHPDTNKGSEAAAELFRQLNEAYRVLSDERLRQSYDRKIDQQQQAVIKTQHPKPKTEAKPDPQQKFNNFLYSVLGAILETPDPPENINTSSRPPPTDKPTRKVRRRPDFNFYYYLAMERDKSPYSCGDDGIYRRTAAKGRRSFSRTSSNILLLLFAGLWEFFKQ